MVEWDFSQAKQFLWLFARSGEFLFRCLPLILIFVHECCFLLYIWFLCLWFIIMWFLGFAIFFLAFSLFRVWNSCMRYSPLMLLFCILQKSSNILTKEEIDGWGSDTGYWRLYFFKKIWWGSLSRCYGWRILRAMERKDGALQELNCMWTCGCNVKLVWSIAESR